MEGFRRPALAGGLEELVESVAGFPALDLDLLERVLAAYDARYLWAAAGWFLERHRRGFHVPQDLLRRFESKRPTARHYLLRGTRGGSLDSSWNLYVGASELQRMREDRPEVEAGIERIAPTSQRFRAAPPRSLYSLPFAPYSSRCHRLWTIQCTWPRTASLAPASLRTRRFSGSW